MDITTQQDNNPEAIRDRVESKRDDYAGGPETGWQTLEASVDETRHRAAQEWSSATTNRSPAAEQTLSEPGEGKDGTLEQERYSTSAPAGEMPESVGQTGESVETERVTGGTASITDGARDADAMPPFNDEHPIGVGQQCFKCGAYNELDAQICWNCSEELTPTMRQTPGIIESVQPVGTGETPERIPNDETTPTDGPGGARPLSAD
jgi:hypothetical protein